MSPLILLRFLFHTKQKIIFWRSSINVSAGSGKSSHKCTGFDNIKHLRRAIQPKGVIGLLSHIINKLFTSWNFVSKFNRAQLSGSFVNHMPSILNLGGFHSNFRCGMYLVLLLVFDPNHITIVFSILIFNPGLFPKSSRIRIVSSNVLLFPFWNNSLSSANCDILCLV